MATPVDVYYPPGVHVNGQDGTGGQDTIASAPLPMAGPGPWPAMGDGMLHRIEDIMPRQTADLILRLQFDYVSCSSPSAGIGA